MKKTTTLIIAVVMLLCIGVSMAEQCEALLANGKRCPKSMETILRPIEGEYNDSHTYHPNEWTTYVNYTCNFKYRKCDKVIRCKGNHHVKAAYPGAGRQETMHRGCGRFNDY